MKILSRSFILLGMIVLVSSCLVPLPRGNFLRDDAIDHLEHAIRKLEIGHLNQASVAIVEAANSIRGFNWRLARKLNYIARKIRRTHYHKEDDQEFIDEMIHVLDDIMEILEDDKHHDDHHKKKQVK